MNADVPKCLLSPTERLDRHRVRLCSWIVAKPEVGKKRAWRKFSRMVVPLTDLHKQPGVTLEPFWIAYFLIII